VCTAVRDGRPDRTPFHCTGDYRLGDGALSVDAVIAGGGPITFAITGATGAYEGRTGTAVATPRSRSRLLDHTLRLSAAS